MSNAGQPLRPTVYFIRHGQTEWSRLGRHTGRSDIPLTPPGEDEARELPALLRSVRFAHAFSSPRSRALRTCELAAPRLTPEIEPDLAEWDYGRHEGLP